MLSACGDGLPAGDYNYRDYLVLSEVRADRFEGSDTGSPYFRDVMSHTTAASRYLHSDDAVINAHETLHGLLNQMNNASRERDQFVYLQDGKGAYLTEPGLHASRIAAYLPAGARALAASRASLYLEQQVAAYFPNVLYQFNEWNAYVAGARVGVEMVRRGAWNRGPGVGQDVVDGPMDFFYFASAALLALHDNEPDYLAQNEQFKAGFAMLAEESMKYVEDGLRIEAFGGFHARRLLEHFRTSPENARIRELLASTYGPVWTQRVIGF